MVSFYYHYYWQLLISPLSCGITELSQWKNLTTPDVTPYSLPPIFLLTFQLCRLDILKTWLYDQTRYSGKHDRAKYPWLLSLLSAMNLLLCYGKWFNGVLLGTAMHLDWFTSSSPEWVKLLLAQFWVWGQHSGSKLLTICFSVFCKSPQF